MMEMTFCSTTAAIPRSDLLIIFECGQISLDGEIVDDHALHLGPFLVHYHFLEHKDEKGPNSIKARIPIKSIKNVATQAINYQYWWYQYSVPLDLVLHNPSSCSSSSSFLSMVFGYWYQGRHIF